MLRALLLCTVPLVVSGCAGVDIFGQMSGQKIATKPAPEPLTPDETLAMELKDIRARMVARADVSDAELSKLAGSGDGLAAYNLAGRLSDRGDDSALTYYIQAVDDGLDYAYLPMTKLLRRDDVTFHQDKLAIARKALAQRANADASMALLMVEFYDQGHPFGADPDEAHRYLTIAAEKNDAGAALKLATRYLLDSEDRTAGHPAARKYLEIAATGQDLAARVTAENLLRSLGPVPDAVAGPAATNRSEGQA